MHLKHARLLLRHRPILKMVPSEGFEPTPEGILSPLILPIGLQGVVVTVPVLLHFNTPLWIAVWAPKRDAGLGVYAYWYRRQDSNLHPLN